MRQACTQISFRTEGSGLYEVSRELEAWVMDQGMDQGLLTLYMRHTSASLIIQENADSDVLHDLKTFFSRLVPEAMQLYRHSSEGPDDMPAHIKSALTQTSLSIPLMGGRLALGTWQGIYIFEHRAHPHQRTLALHLMGE